MTNRKNNSLHVIDNTTCFSEHKKRNLSCANKDCRLWLNSEDSLNCTVLACNSGPKTLQEIGELFNVTRMRICQIEKSIMSKLLDSQYFEK
jgi:DNA-directed RNA polymerase sigma subunit (sigma70/sigma32)